MKPTPLIENFAWYGVTAVLVAYAAINLGWMPLNDPLYVFLNVTGSIAIGLDAYAHRNWQPVVLNAVWMTIALIGLARTLT